MFEQFEDETTKWKYTIFSTVSPADPRRSGESLYPGLGKAGFRVKPGMSLGVLLMRFPIIRDGCCATREKEVWQDLQQKGFSQVVGERVNEWS